MKFRQQISQLHWIVLMLLGGLSIELAHSQNVEVSNPFQIGEVQFFGSSCNGEGKTSVIFSPDQSTASLLFASFSAEVGTGSMNPNAYLKRSDCTARVPITLQSHFALTGFSNDMRGFGEVNQGASARLISHYLLWVPSTRYVPSYRHSKVLKKFRGPASEDFNVNETRSFDKRSTAYSCGKKVYLDIAMTLETRSNHARAFALLSLDSLDLAPTALEAANAIKLSLVAARCR